MRPTKKFKYGDPVVVTGGEHEGKTGQFQFPCCVVVTDEDGEMIHVMSGLLRPVNAAPASPAPTHGEYPSLDKTDVPIKKGDYVRIKVGENKDKKGRVASDTSGNIKVQVTVKNDIFTYVKVEKFSDLELLSEKQSSDSFSASRGTSGGNDDVGDERRKKSFAIGGTNSGTGGGDDHDGK